MKNIKYYIRATNQVDLWKKRSMKKQSSCLWKEVTLEEGEECIKTKKYTMEIFPDNDDYHCTHTFDVIVKKEIITTEFYK